MTALEKFRTDVENWFAENGFSELGFTFGEDFAYIILSDEKLGIQIGVQAYPEVGRYFEQFLYEYGLEYTGIYDPVLAMLHELGHNQTVHYMDEAFVTLCDLAKQFVHTEDEHEAYNEYWLVPDEFLANLWEIDFINTHIEAVEKLCDIYAQDWSAIFEEMTIEELLKEVA